ncbi:hypothetical protein DCC79_08130 [bacterium]|nr:MAG: hypothetical protein DCC79_08130 [bacterium]
MLLLVVLSMLVLFLMIGTAFVIVAKQSEQAGKAGYKGAVRTSTAAAQQELLEEALRQVIRDTNNPYSVIRGHSLLADMYGNDGLKGVIAVAGVTVTPPNGVTVNPPRWAAPAAAAGTNPTAGQILEFDVATADLGAAGLNRLRDLYGNDVDPAGQPLRFSHLDGAYAGQTLTFLTGRAEGRSARIVGFIPPTTFRVINFELEDGALVTDPAVLSGTADQPTRVLITGRPFNGTGAGFNPWADEEAPKLNAVENVPGLSWPNQMYPQIALMPNGAFRAVPAQVALPTTPPNSVPPGGSYFPFAPAEQSVGLYDWNGRGGADESYDAVDYQNMALALVPGIDEQLSESAIPPGEALDMQQPQQLPATLGAMVIPSWHRPELIHYWAQRPPFARGNGDVRRSSLAASATMLRKVMLRPNWLDHPNFTGSNPEMTSVIDNLPGLKLARAIYGPWDVDNDNDGVRDSVWIDVGLPVMNGPNGKLVKPLAAMLIVDMDGRLNVNAHGTLDLADAVPGVAPDEKLADGVTESDDTPRGVGYGPADISLEAALGNDFRRLLIGDQVSLRGQNVLLAGRYGFDPGMGQVRLPGVAGTYDLIAQVNTFGWPHWADARDPAGNPQLIAGFATPPDLRARYGMGLNFLGQPVFEATLAGEIRAGSDKNLIVDSPYELKLARATAPGVHGEPAGMTGADAPFAVAELERVLRIYDADSGALPARLALLSGVLSPSGAPTGGVYDRMKLTTDSYDPPAPNVSLPHEMHELLSEYVDPSTNQPLARLPRSVAELFEMRVRVALFGDSDQVKFPMRLDAAPNSGDQNGNKVPDTDDVRFVLRRILAPELAEGRRFDVNRPLGNGRDDNGNGVVDEPLLHDDANGDGNVAANEIAHETGTVWPNIQGATAAATAFSGAPFPVVATEILPPNATFPGGVVGTVDHRALYARHLYALALTLTADPGFDPLAKGNRPGREDGRTGNDARDHDQLLARNLAQWAANVVDYRDPDNIMTPFEYDPDPFDGWDVNDEVKSTSDRTALGANIQVGGETDPVVWGLERPELVITETLAWHDRRTDDSAQADAFPPSDGPDTIMEDPDNPDEDFDSLVRPRGALFVELYNPWPGSPGVNADTHRARIQGTERVDLGVDLARTHNNQRTGDPVWRLAIYKRRQADAAEAALWDPDDPNPSRRPRGAMDRSVYFTGRDPGFDDDGVAFFNYWNPAAQRGNQVRPVRPGRMLVVSSGDDPDGDGIYDVPIGDRKGARNPRQQPKLLRRFQLDTRNLAGRQSTVRYMDADADVNDPAIADTMVQGGAGAVRLEAPREGLRDAQNNLVMTAAFSGDTSGYITDVAIIDRVDDGAGNPIKRRLTVSEPAEGYPDKFRAAEWDESLGQYKPLAIDVPLDGPIGGESALQQQFASMADWPSYLARFNNATRQWESLVDPVLTQIRDPKSQQEPDLGASYSYIYLQRLANPLLPWNPPPPAQGATPNGHNPDLPVNPYVTVDSKSVNLTVLNSRGNDSGEEEDGSPANNARDRFASHERGFTAEVAAQNRNTFVPSLYAFEMPSGERLRPPRRGVKLLPTPDNTYNERRYRPNLAASNDYWFNSLPYSSIGFLNRPFQDTTLTDPARNAKPAKPFEWLTWANRPLISGNELMLAPRVRASRLARDFTIAENPPQNWSPYEPPTAANAAQPGVFDQLLGFFYEELPQGQPAPGVPLHMYRLLEYVDAPSLYAGTQEWLNPSLFQNPVSGTYQSGYTPTITDATDPRLSLAAPFNRVNELRDPGRVNLNTVFSRDVWDGLHHGRATRDGSRGADVHIGPDFDDEFAVSRRGFNAANPATSTDQDAMLLLRPMPPLAATPTFFVNPLRAPDAGDLVPLPELVRKGVEVGIARSYPDVSQSMVQSTKELLFTSEANRPYDDPSRNPFFVGLPMIRLDNLVTTRSNVYAVWITIGFFEVEQIDQSNWSRIASHWGGASLAQAMTDPLFNRVYPDGYMLGREDGADTGAVRRLRGFYIIDRSLPVGFEPGVDHNYENVIRLRRRME